jgi:hypothetical protein
LTKFLFSAINLLNLKKVFARGGVSYESLARHEVLKEKNPTNILVNAHFEIDNNDQVDYKKVFKAMV